jgi:hypothetical protein
MCTLTMEVGVWLLGMTHRLIITNICAKLFQIPLINDTVMDRTRKCDGCVDRRPDRAYFYIPLFFFEKAGDNKSHMLTWPSPPPNVFVHWGNVYVVEQNNSILRGLSGNENWWLKCLQIWNLCGYWWLKITKGKNSKIMQGRLSFLCAALLLNEIYPPMNFQIDTSNTIKMSSRQKVWKITKGNKSKIIKGTVIILAHSIPRQ